MENLGRNLREIRESKGMTLQQVALASGYDAGNLSKLERGRIRWSEPALKAIALALDVPEHDLFLSADERLVLQLWSTLGIAERNVFLRMAGKPEIKETAAVIEAPAEVTRIKRYPPTPQLATVHRLRLAYQPIAIGEK